MDKKSKDVPLSDEMLKKVQEEIKYNNLLDRKIDKIYRNRK